MSKFTLTLLVICAVAIYCATEAEAKQKKKKKFSCGTPPSDATFHQRLGNSECDGDKKIQGKNCCCKCKNASKGRGYYCNDSKYKWCSGTPGTSSGNQCPDPPGEPDFYPASKFGESKCAGVRNINGKKCCCRCSGVSKANGYYCGPDYCPNQASTQMTTSATTATTSANGGTTSASGGTTSASSGTTSAAGSTTSAAGSTTSASGTSSAAGSSSSSGSTSSSSGSSDSTTSSSGTSSQSSSST